MTRIVTIFRTRAVHDWQVGFTRVKPVGEGLMILNRRSWTAVCI